MSRHLALDWDHQSLRIVAASLRAGTIRLEQAAFWQEQQSPNIAEAEALGRHLRERIKAAGIAPAPVLACVGRDRVIVREVRYPAVAAGEEPAIIRFQVLKELSDSADDVVIDYAPLGEAAPGEERRALVFTVRRELLAAYQTLCRAAGLKLVALTPRPFGTLACLRASMNKWQGSGALAELPAGGPGQAAVALLTAADGWSEFCLVHNDSLVVARSLPAGLALPAEVRRNLAMYTAQSPRHTVSALYLAGNGDQGLLRDSLQEALDLPLRTFDPFLDAEEAALPGQDRGAFAGAVGLLRLQASGQPLPINFVSPKQPQAARDPNQRRLALAGGLAAAFLIGVVLYCYARLADLDRDLEAQISQRISLEQQVPQLEQHEKRYEALNGWQRGNINWLDELYDLAALMPDHHAMLLSALDADARAVSKDKPTATLTLVVGTRAGDIVDTLLEQMRTDKHYLPHYKQPRDQNRKDWPANLAQQFMADILVERQPPEKYQRRLPATALTAPLVMGERPWLRPSLPSPPRPVSSADKKIAAWEQGTPHVFHYTPPPVRPVIPGRTLPGTPPPGPNSFAAPAPASDFQERFRQLLEYKKLEGENSMPATPPAVESPLRTQRTLRQAMPSAPAAAPKAAAPAEGKEKSKAKGKEK